MTQNGTIGARVAVPTANPPRTASTTTAAHRPSTAEPPAVSISGLVKSYGGRRVIDGIDLEIHRGETFALLGPNGAGKTTTIEILEGFRSRDGGDVTVLGTDPAKTDRRWRARVGVVAQSTGDALNLSAREMMDHFAVYHANPAPTADLIAAVGLEQSADTRVNALSGGQRRRLEVALGVQGQPDLLFLDEPTTGLDPAARRQFWALIRKLRTSGTTILLTTHYLDEAAQLADRVGVLSRGKLLEVAPPDELGGRLRNTATVSWREGADRREVGTATPTDVLRELLAQTPNGEIEELSVYRPSLEDIYLAMIDSPAGTEEALAEKEPTAAPAAPQPSRRARR